MSRKLKVVAVSGGANRPSRTLVLVEALLEKLREARAIDEHVIQLGDIAPALASSVSRNSLSEELAYHVNAIENADLVLAATPVYRGSYTGLFKHLFDLIHHESLIDVPVLLAATGGSDRHALLIDQQLRPLFSFFQAVTLPVGVYGTDADFTEYRINNAALHARIELAVKRALPLLRFKGHAEQSWPVLQAAVG